MRGHSVFLAAAAAALMSGALVAGSTGALAASTSQRECEAAGGTYTKDGSSSICVFPEQQVANENASPSNNSQTTQTTSTGQGNLDNKTTSTCSGPPGQC